MFNHNNEFSLIELIVVVAVLGLLASIVIPNVNDMQQKAYVVHIQGNIRDVQTAVDMYRIDNGSYPVGVQPTPSSPQFIDFNLLYPEYLKNLPTYNERYWVDFLGTVWGSHTDIPVMKGQGTSVVSWETVPGVEHYFVYEVINKNGQTATSLIGSIAGSTGDWHFESLTSYTRKELFEVKAFPESKVVQFVGSPDKQYIVASQDDMGFYTAPGGDELDTPITLEDGQFERTMYVNTAAPSIADWLSVSDKKIVPEGSSITYQFAYSNDKGKTLSEWYDNIEDVPDSTYLRVKVTLTGTETARPILQQLKINYKLQKSEAESCTVNLYQQDQDCKMEQNKELVTTETIKVDKVIPPKGSVTIPVTSGNPVISVTPSYSGSTSPDISYSDGSNSFDHPSQGKPTQVIIKNPSDKPLTVPDITINRTEKSPTVQTAEPEVPEEEEEEENWKEVDRFTLIEDAGEVVTWTKVEFTQNKPNTDSYRLRVSVDGTKLEDYKSGTSIGKSSQEISVNFIGEVEETSGLTWKDVPYPETITVYFTTKDGTKKYKEYTITKSPDGSFNKVLKNEGSSQVSFASATITQLKMGQSHGLALTSDGQVFAWGSNYYGQLGDGTTVDSKVPKLVTGLPKIAQLSTGYNHNFAITENGQAYGWGHNSSGQLGGSSNSKIPQKIYPLSDIVQIACGESHSISLSKDGTVSVFGSNSYKQNPDDAELAKLPKIKQVTSGANFVAVLTVDGEVYAWGQNKYSQIGLGDNYRTSTTISVPKKVPDLLNVKYITAGIDHTLALTEDGKVYGWGYNFYGQVGNGSNANATSPVSIDTLSNVKQIAAGHKHSMALTESGQFYTWGSNSEGELGNGSSVKKSSPVLISLSNVEELSAGLEFSSVRTKDNHIYTWGVNYRGELGNGGSSSKIPTKIK